MNKLTFALIVALSSGYASASDATTWGGNLDGHFEQISIGTMGSVDRNSGPIDIESAYKGLDGDIAEHFFASGMTSSVQVETGDMDETYADLDGNNDLAGDV